MMGKYRIILAFLFTVPSARAQAVTVRWGDTYQVIDGFGASDYAVPPGSPLSSAQNALFWGQESGQLGLSLLRTGVTNGGSDSLGDCTTVSLACAGPSYQRADSQAAISYGAKVWSAVISPPAAYKTNRSTICNAGSGNGFLATDSYAAFASWLVNYVKSLATYASVSLYALSVQNEPNNCPTTYDGALYTGTQLDGFIRNNLGPEFRSNGIRALIMMPESTGAKTLANRANTTMNDRAAAAYVGIIAWHDYDASWNPPNAAPNPYLGKGKRYWQTEASAFPGAGPSLCSGCWDPSMADALIWARIIDDRLAVENANAWSYWRLIGQNATNNEGLMNAGGAVAKHAYVLGQYSRFVRPGYYRIHATHSPQADIYISAYKHSQTNTLTIVAINNSNAGVWQKFLVSHAPSFASLRVYITDPTRNIAPQPSVAVHDNSFSFTLPAYSVTTFTGQAGDGRGPTPDTRVRSSGTN